ncbi:hypothetical protein Hanom_Chr16g01473681 [Helianthus anomalus]
MFGTSFSSLTTLFSGSEDCTRQSEFIRPLVVEETRFLLCITEGHDIILE